MNLSIIEQYKEEIEQELKERDLKPEQIRSFEIERHGCIRLEIYDDLLDNRKIGWLCKSPKNKGQVFYNKTEEKMYKPERMEWEFVTYEKKDHYLEKIKSCANFVRTRLRDCEEYTHEKIAFLEIMAKISKLYNIRTHEIEMESRQTILNQGAMLEKKDD